MLTWIYKKFQSKLDFGEMPHACFKLTGPLSEHGGAGLAKAMAKALDLKVAKTHLSKTRVPALWTIRLPLVEPLFAAVLIRKSEYARDEWILSVGVLEFSRLIPVVHGHGQAARSKEIQSICREVHAVLTGMPFVKDLRWYFSGRRRQREAVATPDDLKWSGNA